jgi:enamine deaminase RidA (YjgF/YER057c/UK114 family)
VYQRINSQAIALAPPGRPVAAYVPWVMSGNLLFVSGHVSKNDGRPWVGQLGRDMDTEAGILAARAVAVDILGTLEAATGNLDRVARVVKVVCFVNSTADYTEQHKVANGFSELIELIFGEAGKHARSAIGVPQLPTGAAVEVELIAELR